MNQPAAPAAGAASLDASAVQLRRACVSDAEAFARLFGHREVVPHVVQLPYPSPEHWRESLVEMCAAGSGNVLLVAVAGDELVGFAGLHPMGMAARRRHAMEVGIVVAPAWQGRGIGDKLLSAQLELADRWLGVLRLELEVYVDNERAQRLYRRHGFVEEGVRRAFALRDGVYADVLAMARLHPSQPRVG